MTPRVRKLRAIVCYGRVWASGVAVQLGLRSERDRMLRPRITGDVPVPSEAEVLHFIRTTGGNPEDYRLPGGTLLAPHSWFAAWGWAELARAILAARLPLNLSQVVHAFASTRIRRLTPIDEPMRFVATVETVVRTGPRVRIDQSLVTTTLRGELLAEQEVSLLLPGRRPWVDKARRQENVPQDCKALATFDLPSSQGWDFANLSGDFNPVHWMSPFAWMHGLEGTVAHGFDLFARMGHAAVVALADRKPSRVVSLEARFRLPVTLPATLAVHAGSAQSVGSGVEKFPLWVASQASPLAHAVGSVEVQS